MKTIRKISIFTIIIMLILLIPTNIKAADEITTTLTINGNEYTFKYELDENGNAKNLVCTNPENLTGTLNVPPTVDGKTVVSLGYKAFAKANEITEITIPNSVKEIGGYSFDGCTSLANINFGTGVERLGIDAFKDCTSLTSLTIPKSLIKSCGNSPFEGCKNITSVTFEDGITEIPAFICQGLTGITEITIPNSVKEIGGYSFDGCTNLAKINFGTGVERLGIDAFKDCTSLTSLTIPKSLIKSCGNYPFQGCKNITSVTFEDGITEIPAFICEDMTGLISVKIPESVTKIGGYAFSGCTNLSQDLVFSTNLVNIGIEAFSDCPSLKKITLLKSVKDMGWGLSNENDSVFQNHNQDLTIYCNRNSIPAEYAIKYNIKYVYLDEETVATGEKNNNENEGTIKTDDSDNKKDPTVAPTKIPQTGQNVIVAIAIVSVVGLSVYTYRRLKNYRDII